MGAKRPKSLERRAQSALNSGLFKIALYLHRELFRKLPLPISLPFLQPFPLNPLKIIYNTLPYPFDPPTCSSLPPPLPISWYRQIFMLQGKFRSVDNSYQSY